ncbi:MAG: SprB repeat-containing protein [Bacteroidia bacterium]|nr:SprB repeat-containing protein [Bacteroidia bacterium]
MTDANGCQDSASVTITQPSGLIVSIASSVNVSCFGGSNGSAIAFGSGSTGGYTYLWSNGQTGAVATNLVAGTYQVTATSGAGCTAVASVVISQPAALTVTPVLLLPLSCFGDNNALATSNAIGGTSPYAYFWSNGQSGPTAPNLSAGTYTVIVTDSKGCVNNGNVNVPNPAQVVGAIGSVVDVTCFGGSDGQATGTASGGTGTFTYLWDNGQTSATATGLTAGSYQMVVTDGNGCSDTVSTTISQPTDIQISASILTNVSCFGLSNGSAVASASGGNGAYSYVWSNGQVGAGVSGLVAGTYTVVVTDGNGCQDSASVTITQPVSLAPTLSITADVSCFGGSDATASVSIGGGTGPFSYVWSNGDTLASTSGLSAGFLSVIVTDSNGCQETATGTVQEPTAVSISLLATSPISCLGGNDGEITAIASGGTGAFSYLWSNGQTGPISSALVAGTYSVVATDANGCNDSAQFTLSAPSQLLVSATVVSQVTCFGGANGQAVAAASGGTGSYSFLWSNGQTGAMATNLVAGVYSVIVTDSLGCVEVDSVAISEPAALLVSASMSASVSCHGGADGIATASANGGTAPYAYSWSNGQSGATANGLAAGNYSVFVTDSVGCVNLASVQITEPAALVLAMAQVSGVTCFGASNGAAMVSVFGGNAPFTYLWSNGDTTATASGFSAGIVTVVVTDGKGCEAIDSVVISQPSVLEASSSLLSPVTCVGGNDATLSAAASGGSSPYNFAWSNGQNGPIATTISAGVWILTVTDANGCQDTVHIQVFDPQPMILTTSSVSDVSCFGGNDGSASVSATGGAGGFGYLWSNGQSGSSATGLLAQTYTVVVTDANGCQDSATVSISEPSEVLATAMMLSPTSCFGLSDGSAIASASGGTSPYSFSWSNGQSGATATGLAAGTYVVTITDANGCVDTASVLISAPVNMAIVFQMVQPVSCVGQTDGEILAIVSGGTAPYSFLWNTGDTSSLLAGLAAGTFVLTSSDANGCSVADSFTLIAPNAFQVAIDKLSDITCPGGSDGVLIAGAIGGTAPYSYLWSTGDTTASVSGLSAGNYAVEVTDANGCSSLASDSLMNPAGVQAVIQVFDSVSCYNQADGSLLASANGGLAPYQYAWSTGGTGTKISGLPAGTYSLFATDANGCMDTTTSTLLNPDSLTLSLSVLTPLVCSGAADGILLASGSGGTSPLSFYWDNLASGDTLFGVGAGQYVGVVVDVHGCDVFDTISLISPPPIVISPVIVTDLSCFGANDGAITVNVSGGTGALSLLWSHGPISNAVTGLSAGTYLLTVTDSAGCVKADSFVVNEPPALSGVTALLNGISCFGLSDGSIEAQVSGGTSPYSILWNTGDTASVLNNLPAGIYTFTVTDASGCSVTASYTLLSPSVVVGALSGLASPLCHGQATGSATISATGGAGNYSYLWSSGSTSATVNNLPAGTFWVTITDSNGCQDSVSGLMTPTDTMIASISISQSILCAGDLGAALSVTVQGGTPGYSYNWSNGLTGSNPSGLAAGTYFVTVSDLNGCTDTASIAVSEPDPLVIAILVNHAISCPSDSDGEVAAVVSGGTAPYTFQWDNGQTDSVAINLVSGTYVVTVSDANACTDTHSVTLIAPSPLQTSILVQQPISCIGSSDGALSVVVTGGTVSYTYSWSNGKKGNQINNLAAGLYAVTVTDGNGCIDTASFLLEEPDSLFVQPMLVSGITCAGGSDAMLSALVSGGTPGFQFSWSPGGIADTLTGAGPGMYVLTVTDVQGCTATDSIEVFEPAPISLTGEITQEILCFGGDNGAVEVSATGGVIPYSWTWKDGTIGETRSGLSAGSYTAFLTDSLGCVDSIAIVLEEPSAMSLGMTALGTASCEDATNGQARVSVIGGTAPYQYQWSSIETQDTAFALGAGWQSVLVIDSVGCEAIDSVWIDVSLPWSASISILDTIHCFGGSDGVAEVLISGIGTGFSYFWSNGEMTNPATSLSADTTTVLITDLFGCDTTVFVVMDQPEEIDVRGRQAATDPGAANGAIRIDTVLNGEGPFSYLWTNGATGSIISDLDTGLYQVIVRDVNGCEGTASFRIGENSLDWSNFAGIARCELGLVDISWDVTEETGVEFFSIEQSGDGLIYTRVAERPSLGDTIGLRSYILQDSFTPLAVTSYRIRAHYANGNSTASEAFDVSPCQTDSGFVDVFPVPVQLGETFSAVFMMTTPGEVRVELRNAIHQTLQFYQIPDAIGRQIVIFKTEALASGHYYVIVSNESEAYSARVLVVE